ncbi:hypothetical protein ACFYWP_22970 [Actinacidiphila glaucinigra]|uniref:hypothetical protein n=1 Tax=Actinacidiphila glaucinigra TaxID=235986 RepID=UPI003690F99A
MFQGCQPSYRTKKGGDGRWRLRAVLYVPVPGRDTGTVPAPTDGPVADVAALAAALVADDGLVDALTAAAVGRRDEECRAEADALAALVAKRHPDG